MEHWPKPIDRSHRRLGWVSGAETGAGPTWNRHRRGVADPVKLVTDSDLPCPWCHGPTTDVDTRCPSCGHRFG